MAFNLTITNKTQVAPNRWRILFDNQGRLFVLRRRLGDEIQWIIVMPQKERDNAADLEQDARNMAALSFMAAQFPSKIPATQWTTHEMTLYHHIILTDQEKDQLLA